MPPAAPDTTDPRAARAWALAIEASNPSAGEGDEAGTASVAGARLGGGVPGEAIEVRYEAGSRKADGLLPAIDRVRAALGVAPAGLARVCVSAGPGGYTGLRVSVTVAKTLAMATGAEAVGVPSASVAVGASRPDRPFAVCLASKGGRTHATRFSDPDSPVGEPIGVIGAEDLRGALLDRGIGILIADRFLPEPFRSAFEQAGGAVLAPRFSAVRCLSVGCLLPPTDPVALVPAYAREPEAVRLWRERRSSNA
jgi:tRNA threonylcarbamoyl adenosine modification protein YeaZ